MIFYGAFFVVLSVRLRTMLDPRLLGVALAAMMLTVLLDCVENHHIMTMVHAIQNGLPLSPADGELQMIASLVKFHASYLAVLLFSFGYLQFGKLGKRHRLVLWCYIPFGVLISVTPVESGQGAGARTDDLLRLCLHPVRRSCSFRRPATPAQHAQ